MRTQRAKLVASPARPEAHLCVANAASPPRAASPASSAKASQAAQPCQRAHPGHPTHTAQAARPAQTKRSAKPCAATWFNAVHTDRLSPAHHLCNTTLFKQCAIACLDGQIVCVFASSKAFNLPPLRPAETLQSTHKYINPVTPLGETHCINV